MGLDIDVSRPILGQVVVEGTNYRVVIVETRREGEPVVCYAIRNKDTSVDEGYASFLPLAKGLLKNLDDSSTPPALLEEPAPGSVTFVDGRLH